MEGQDKVAVPLHHLRAPAIVGKASTGLIYSNQTHCVACKQSRAEGFLVPLPLVDSRLFDPTWWYYARFGMGRPDHLLRTGKTIEQARQAIDSELATLAPGTGPELV